MSDQVSPAAVLEEAKRPALENIANRCGSRAQPGTDYRAERWSARGVLWDVSSLRRVTTCGRWSIRDDGTVEVRRKGEAVGYAGLATCGSVWACPVCNAKVQAFRRLEVATGLTAALEGGSAAFGAYTLQHRAGQPLRPLWKGLSTCWHAVTQSRAVRSIREDLGHVGIIRAAEVTHGLNGWHPHLHPVHVFGQAVSVGDVAALHEAQFRAWRAAASRLGLAAPSFAAQDLHLVGGGRAAGDALGDYFAKAVYGSEPLPADSVGWEMTSTQTKARTRAKDSRTPWDVLRDFYTTGDLADLDLWHHWERGSKGMRALTWSRGLRDRLGLDAERDDDQVAAEVVGTAEDTGFLVTDWSPVAANPRLGAELLSVVQQQGWGAGRLFCGHHHIPIRQA